MVIRNEFNDKTNLSSNDHVEREDAIVLAQAIDTPPAATLVTETPAPTAAEAAAAPKVTLIAIEDGSIARLPEGANIEQPRMNGADLEFVQPDGSIISIPGGAITGLTLFVGGLEIPPITVAALFEANNIQPAAGPAGAAAGTSHPNYEIVNSNGVGEGLGDTTLLDNSLLRLVDADGLAPNAANLAPLLEVRPFTNGYALFEDGLPTGNPEGGETLTASGQIIASDVDRLDFSFGTPGNYFSGGYAIQWSTNDAGDLIGTANGKVIITATITDGFTDEAGKYTITLSGPIDHPGGGEDILNLAIPVTVTDGFFSVDTTLTIAINDDIPVLVAPARLVFDESSLPTGNPDFQNGEGQSSSEPAALTQTGSLGIAWGADNGNSNPNGGFTGAQVNGDRSVVFGDLPEGLTSHGVSIAYVLSANGTVLTATAGGQPVFTVTLNDVDGTYTFELQGNIDHPDATSQDVRDITFGFIATDADGDAVAGRFVVGVKDDAPVSGGVVTSSTVLDDEAQTLFPGNAGGLGDVANEHVATGTAGSLFTAGADGVQSVAITGPSFAVIYQDGGFAKSESVSWSTGVKGADGSTTFTATSTHYSNGAAVLVINADGSYVFTLNAPVVQSTVGASEENKTLSFGFTVTDGDNDKASGTLNINVNDDAPVSKGTVTPATVLDDEAQGNGNAGTSWLGDVADAKIVSGAAGSLFTAGADGVQSVAINGPAFNVIYTDAQGFAQAESVSWSNGVKGTDGSTTFTATSTHYATSAAVLVINANGSYTFTLNAPVAHDVALPAIEENKTLSFGFTVTDGDNDTATGTLNIRVNDDTPTPVASIVFASQTMDDEAQGLFTPTNPGGLLDVSADVKSVSGTAGSLFKIGADGLGTLSVGLPGFSVIYKDGGFAKTEAVTWDAGVRGANGTTTYTATGTASHNTAAVLVIKADGSYSFTLDVPVAHALSSTFEDNKVLTFTYSVKDGDGDQAGGTLSVSVNDDTPKVNVVTSSTVLDDEAQTLFPGNNLPADGVANVGTVSGAAGSLFTAGADGVQSVAINGPAFNVIYQDGGFAKSESVSWSTGVMGTDGSTTFTATSTHYASGAAVLVINANGSYSFTLNAPVVHPSVGAVEENKTLSFGFTVTDGDGDKAGGTLNINVNDDAPTAGYSGRVTVTEDAIEGSFAGQPVSGQFVFSGGSDGARVTSLQYGAGSNQTGIQAYDADAVGSGVTRVQLTSGGEPIKTELSADGLTLTGKTAAGVEVFTLHVDNAVTGAYTFKQLAPIDHPDANESGVADPVRLRFNFTVTDGDGDTADGHIQVDILDDAPTASYSGTSTVTEAGTAGGAFIAQSVGGTLVFNAGADDAKVTALTFRTAIDGDDSGSYPVLKSHTVALSYETSVANGLITLTAKAGATIVFTLEANQETGAYKFTQLASIDHPDANQSGTADPLRLVFDFAVTDGDGDTTAWNTGTVQVDILDDAPAIVAPQDGTVTEDGHVMAFANGSFENGSLVAGQADVIVDVRGNYTYVAPNGWAISNGEGGTFAPTSAITDAAGHSGGNVVWLRNAATLSQDTGAAVEDGKIYSAHFNLGDRTDQTFPGGTARLIATNGTDTIVLKAITLPTPADGKWSVVDISSGVVHDVAAGYTLRLEITQGNAGSGEQILIDNVELSQFNPATDTGHSLGINWGADGAAAVEFDGAAAPSDLTSNGHPVSYAYSADNSVLTASTDDGRVVFTVTLSAAANGSYVFTLLDNLDHGAADARSLTFGFKATDGDHDSATGSFKVTVNDDTLDLDAIAGQNIAETTLATTNTFVAQTLSDVSLHIDWAADDANPGVSNVDRSVTFTQETVDALVAQHLQSNGYDLEFVPSADGTTLTAYRVMPGQNPITQATETHYVSANGGDLLADLTAYVAEGARVFSVKLSDTGNGSYSFTLYDNLDHAVGGNVADLPITLKFTATDADSDHKDGSFVVNVGDTVPTVGQHAEAVTVSEINLANVVQSRTGMLDIDWNADNGAAKHIEFVTSGLPADLKSDGIPLLYSVTHDANGNDELIAYKQGDANKTPVFSIQFTEPNPAYTFTLYQNLDHATGSDQLSLTFKVTATDGDGDPVDQTFQVNVGDDLPTISGAVQHANLLANGNFAAGVWPHSESWGSASTGSTGWKIEGTAEGQTGVQAERVNSGYLGMVASGNASMIDLGASPGDIQLSQTITGLVAGEIFKLSFELGSPDVGSSLLQVLWNGNLVGTYQPGSSMSLATADLIALAGTNTLTFKEIGTASDNTGTYLANVVLEPTAAGIPVVHGAMGEDSPATFTFQSGAEFNYGADGAGTVVFDTSAATIAGTAGAGLTLPTITYSEANGTFTVTPNGAFNALAQGDVATLSVPFTITDGDGDTKTGLYQITITGANDAPVLTGDLVANITSSQAYTLTKDDLYFTDADDTMSGVSFKISAQPSGGVITVGGAASLSFTATQLAQGEVKFLHNGSPGSTVTLSVSVEDGNEDGSTPVAQTFTFNVAANEPLGEASDLAARYAFSNATYASSIGEPSAIAINLADLFTGTSANTTYQVRPADLTFGNLAFNSAIGVGGWNWLTLTNNVLSGTPGTAVDHSGSYMAQVIATDAVTHAVSTVFVQFSVLENGAVRYDLANGAGNTNGEGDDLFKLSGGNVAEIHAGNQDDVMLGDAGDNKLNGGDYDDALHGNAGNDTLKGENGRDYLSGGAGDDILDGGEHDDVLVGGSGHDTLKGGDGTWGNDWLYGNEGDDKLYGGMGADHLFGGIGNDKLYTGDSNLSLSWDSKNWLDGGEGNDTLVDLNFAKDELTGGAGADTFVMTHTNGNSADADTITDYVLGEGDKVDLSALLDANFNSGDDPSKFVKLTVTGDTISVQVDTNGITGGQNWSTAVDLAHAASPTGHGSVVVIFEGIDHTIII